MQKIFGYARVSTKEQNEDRQLRAFLEQGKSFYKIYTDKQSGKDFDRPEYVKMLRRLKKGDLLFIKSIDRLGRNYKEILEQWRVLTKEKCIDICVLDLPLLDTRHTKDLFGTFISDLVLQLVSFFAENERINIKKRQAEGIAAAHLRGVKFGRPRKAVPEQFEETCRKWSKGEITCKEAARLCKMPVSTFRYKAGRRGMEECEKK